MTGTTGHVANFLFAGCIVNPSPKRSVHKGCQRCLMLAALCFLPIYSACHA